MIAMTQLMMFFQDVSENLNNGWENVTPWNALGYSLLVGVLMWFGYQQFTENKKILKDNIEMLTKVNIYLDSDDIPKKFAELKEWLTVKFQELNNKIS